MCSRCLDEGWTEIHTEKVVEISEEEEVVSSLVGHKRFHTHSAGIGEGRQSGNSHDISSLS